ncbi:MAG: HAMP domain-containing sensor histidine kinase [Bacteroidota bacterium]
MPRTSFQLFGKISLALLSLLVVLGVTYVVITSFVAGEYMQEVNQRLYGGIANSTVNEVRPLVDGEVDTIAIKEIMHSIMIMNPSAEVYLLDTAGTIITYVAPYKKILLEEVGLDPVIQYIDAEEKPFIKGDDPRHPGEVKVFSAARLVNEDKLEGYLYIILASEEQAAVTESLSGSYMLRLGSNWFFISLIGTLALGLLAIWYLTRNLRRIVAVVKRFKEGDYEARISHADEGDLHLLGETFNEMADTIVANIEQIQSVERLRRELIANVSHDLRTPLAIMQGYVETLQMKAEDLDPVERDNYLTIIHNSSTKLAGLVAQLFEYSKLEARQIEPEKEAFFIGELAQDVFQKYQLLAKEKGVEMHLEQTQNLPLVFADVGLVERVLQNLMDNALKFTPSGGSVTIGLKALEEAVEVSIADTGPGIPEAEQPYIFERYRKAGRNAEKSKANQGAGLGLAIARKIMELHGSTLRMRSKINEGTAFWFHLPAYAEA